MGRVVAEGHNQVTLTNDPTAHAEITVIRAACRMREATTLPDCVLYSSCEPCPMCLAATYWASIPKIVFACTQQDADKAGFADQYLYEEIARPASERHCQMHELATNNKLDAFTLWNSSDVDVVAYGSSPRTGVSDKK
jgi:tRNA(Arg) A34 adenosine deaminase TadA